jgi:hypothetical protein
MSTDSAIRRRWFQFGIKSLLATVTAAAVMLSWINYNLNWLQQRQGRHRRLSELGCARLGAI